MFELNGTYVIFIALFLAFVYLFNEIGLKPVGELIERRKSRMAADYEAAKASNAESETALKHYEEKIHASRLAAQKILHDAVLTVSKSREQKLHLLQQEGNDKIAAIRNEFTAERDQLLGSMVDAEVALVKDIISRLVGGTTIAVDSARVARALEEAK